MQVFERLASKLIKLHEAFGEVTSESWIPSLLKTRRTSASLVSLCGDLGQKDSAEGHRKLKSTPWMEAEGFKGSETEDFRGSGKTEGVKGSEKGQE